MPRPSASEFPTPWQRKTIWVALTALSTVTIGAIAVGLVWLLSRVLGFLQPILIPFAIAAVMAYLLDPVVSWIVRFGHSPRIKRFPPAAARAVHWATTRQRAVLAVFAVVSVLLAALLLWIVPAIWTQTGNLVRRIPAYRVKLEERVTRFNTWAHGVEQRYGVHLIPQIPEKIENPLAVSEPASSATQPAGETPPSVENPATAAPAAATPPVAGTPSPEPVAPASPNSSTAATAGPEGETSFDLQKMLSGDWVRTVLPTITRNAWTFLKTSVGGFLGVFGFLLSMVIVPIYLYYFLIEAKNISKSWGDYLPLRASAFKDEVVSTLSEINGYLIAFFRGQLLVSVINGTATGLGLVIVGLDFGLLVGLLLCLLGLIPYLGIILCWIPAVIIAAVQGGSGTWLPGDPWWVFPLVVTVIFVIVQQIDGLFITPKVVGESVGLHPMTVIVSVFMWTLLMGGLLGAILAVPMTATCKVLLKRYVWARRFGNPLPTEESFSNSQERLPQVSATIVAE